MGALYFVMFYSYMLLVHFPQQITPASYTLTPSQSITDGQTLVSQGARFELGFFSPSSSEKRYLGIWYKNISLQTVVWVANRDSPLNDKLSSLKIGTSGNLVVVNRAETVIWSSNVSNIIVNPVIELLDTGNLVLRDVRNDDPERYLWESFDYPGDTLLPGMKLGLNFKTGINSYLSSWKKLDDPSNGDYTFGIDPTRYPESVIRKGRRKYYRSGPWNGLQFSGAPDLSRNRVFRYKLVHNPEEVYYMYEVIDPSVTLRVVLTQTSTDGHLQRYIWVDATQSWLLLVSIPRDRCDGYALCGAYSTCEVFTEPVCQCLKGFKPKSPQDWNKTDWSKGCERETLVNCSRGEGFLKYTGVKLPDTTGTQVSMSMNLDECRVNCLKNCSCMAYSGTDISKSGSGTGCVMWFADLIDIRQMDEPNAGQDLFVRMDASALVSGSRSMAKGRIVMIVSIALVAGIVVVGLGSLCIIWKKRSPKGNEEEDDLELSMIDFSTIRNATNNFAEQNKLGEGGFGPVFKGKLGGEQEIAVKRLSNTSIQGSNEFKNEVILISKLQHKNLVKLLGCCVQGEEKMLVYEYMPNKSLDYFIFDDTKSALLNWPKRLQIILGIARGLLYLHHDSRLRIIHRDLKASNILLDNELLPKISDFGLARLFRGDQNEASTERVMGTYGYMSPEYAVDGQFSVKSDVFSFGVLVLEIISGKKNRGFFHPDHELNLLGHAWKLWSEDKSIEFVEESINNSGINVEEVLRCIHIGLLCVQKDVDHRPTMSSVVLMLSSETIVLPKPQQPGFYVARSNPLKENSSTSSGNVYSANETMSLIVGR